jgi:hypothetical protein
MSRYLAQKAAPATVVSLHTVNTASNKVTYEPVLSLWARFSFSHRFQFGVLIYVPKTAVNLNNSGL